MTVLVNPLWVPPRFEFLLPCCSLFASLDDILFWLLSLKLCPRCSFVSLLSPTQPCTWELTRVVVCGHSSLRVYGCILFRFSNCITVGPFYCWQTFGLSLAFCSDERSRSEHFGACILMHTCVPSLDSVSGIADLWVQCIFHLNT